MGLLWQDEPERPRDRGAHHDGRPGRRTGRHQQAASGARLRLSAGRQGPLSRRPGTRRADAGAGEGGGRAEPGVHAPGGRLGGAGGHRPVPRHRDRHPDPAEPPPDRPGGRPGGPDRLHGQRSDRPAARGGAARQHPRGRHRLPGSRCARPGEDPRPRPYGAGLRAARGALDDRPDALPGRGGRSVRHHPHPGGRAARGQLPGALPLHCGLPRRRPGGARTLPVERHHAAAPRPCGGGPLLRRARHGRPGSGARAAVVPRHARAGAPGRHRHHLHGVGRVR